MASDSTMILLVFTIMNLFAIQQIHSASTQQQQQNLDLDSDKKCVPMFDRYTTFDHQKQQQQQQQEQQFGLSHRFHPSNANFSFQVGNIDLPLVMPAEGSIQSAMKLLSTFSSQFDSIMPGEESELEVEGKEEGEDEDEGGQLNVVKFRENKLLLSGLNLSMLNIHLYPDYEGSDPKFGIGITIKNTTLNGKFTYKGPLAPIAIATTGSSSNSLKGYYSMSIDNIYLLVSSNLTKVSKSTNNTTTTTSQQRLKTNDFKLNVTNLGYISIDIYDSYNREVSSASNSTVARQPTSNYLLKMLQKVLQRTIKRTYLTFEHHIRQALELEGRRVLDCELTRFDDLLESPPISTTATATTNNNNNNFMLSSTQHNKQQGDLARVIDREIIHSGLSRVELPTFEHQQSVFGSIARINFYNGSLSGLNTIKMIGETRIKLQDQHLIMNTSLGWLELRPYYNWNLTLGNNSTTRAPVSQGFVSFQIKDFDFDAVVTKGLQDDDVESVPSSSSSSLNESAGPAQRRIVVEQLVIRHLETPKMDIGGLPGMNRLTRGMVNFFMGRLKQRLTGAIQPVLKQQLERSLNKILL